MYDNVTTQCRCFLIQKLLGPVQTYPFLFEHGYFFSGLAHRPHISGENGHRKRIFSKTLSTQSGNFWKRRLFVYVWTDEDGGFQIRWCHISYTANPLLSSPGGWFFSSTLERGGLFKLFSETHQREQGFLLFISNKNWWGGCLIEHLLYF